MKNHSVYSKNEVDVEPDFPGGVEAMKSFVNKHLVWPEEFGNSGYVILSVVVDKDGGFSDAKVKRTLCNFCDQAAKEVLRKMPKWNPGLINNIPVSTRIDVPIRFELN
ncbi:energy transducer TonB [Pedobacter gandavensis]|uniref:energy transducer TonB n=1 Tax=Pedobacter gandavensis TaxID=2679963 RepID=UPI00293185E0|nr:energy transducer TonB [Pedobacter gandavensis]